MTTIGDISENLERFAPTALAEDWDNVGLLVGDASWPVSKVMTCLTVTPTTVREAMELKADLIVSHHPLPFHPLQSVTAETTAGKMLLNLIASKIGVYSPHTAFDSAHAGINQHLAIGLGLQQIEPLVNAANALESDVGSGRIGSLGEEISLMEMAERVKSFLGLQQLQIVGKDDQAISSVSIACGSGGSFLANSIAKKSDCFITGEASLHTCLEAEAQGIGLILAGHFASERFALDSLAEFLSDQYSGIEVWASTSERDPLRVV